MLDQREDAVTSENPDCELDDLDWSTRSKSWAGRYAKQQGAKQNRNSRKPLIITGHGVSLRIDHGALMVCGGFTHHPQDREKYRFFKGQPSLPSRIILLDANGSLSFEVMVWLQEQSVSLIQLNWKGDIVCVSSSAGYSANPHRVVRQREIRDNEAKRLEFSSALIRRKIENSIDVLEQLIPKTTARNFAVAKAYESLNLIEKYAPRSINDLRCVEANTAATYFRAWKGLPIKWRDVAKRPIPDDWNVFQKRTALTGRASNRNARHPANAILNYAYTILQSEMQIAAIAEGYDPTIGVMHEARLGSPAFALDLMEPYRPGVDAAVLEVLRAHTFHAADFVIRSDGVCRLNPELARYIASTVFPAAQGNRLPI